MYSKDREYNDYVHSAQFVVDLMRDMEDGVTADYLLNRVFEKDAEVCAG